MTFKSLSIMYYLTIIIICFFYLFCFLNLKEFMFLIFIFYGFNIMFWPFLLTILLMYTKVVITKDKIIFKNKIGKKKEFNIADFEKTLNTYKVIIFYFKDGKKVSMLWPVIGYWKMIKYLNEIKSSPAD